jgi:hypothetical protein
MRTIVKEQKTQTKGHQRTRREHATELTQCYVEAIAEPEANRHRSLASVIFNSLDN